MNEGETIATRSMQAARCSTALENSLLQINRGKIVQLGYPNEGPDRRFELYGEDDWSSGGVGWNNV